MFQSGQARRIGFRVHHEAGAFCLADLTVSNSAPCVVVAPQSLDDSPATYLMYALGRGTLTTVYSYPWLDPARVAVQGIALNAAIQVGT